MIPVQPRNIAGSSKTGPHSRLHQSLTTRGRLPDLKSFRLKFHEYDYHSISCFGSFGAMKKEEIIPSLCQNTTLRSAALFIGLLVAFWLIFHRHSLIEHVTGPFAAFIASQGAWIIDHLAQVPARHYGAQIYGGGFGVDIRDGCNVVYEIWLFISAIIATPAPMNHKFFGIIVGAIIIYAFNLLRVVVLFVTGLYHKAFFNQVHDHVSQSMLIFVVLILWLFWASFASRRASRS